jgi:hypothetical protein
LTQQKDFHMSSSLAQLESESADFRAAKADAHAEIERLQDRRKRLLLTATIEQILEIDDEIRRQGITGEIAAAKADALRGPIHQARFLARQYAGVTMPTDDELERLLDIVTEAHPGQFRNNMTEFKNAFFAVGRLGRLSEPSNDRYFVSSLDDVNEILRAHRLQSVNGDMMQAAALAWGDCAWRAPDIALGQQPEIALAKLNQGTSARPVWREILTRRADVLPPLPPRSVHASASYQTPRVRIYREDSAGSMRLADASKDLWAH